MAAYTNGFKLLFIKIIPSAIAIHSTSLQVVLWPDPREHQDLRRGDGAGAKDDLFFGVDGVLLLYSQLSWTLEYNSPCPAFCHYHTLHLRILWLKLDCHGNCSDIFTFNFLIMLVSYDASNLKSEQYS